MPLRASSHPGSPNSPSCSALAWYSCWPGLSPWGESGKRTRVARTAALTRYHFCNHSESESCQCRRFFFFPLIGIQTYGLWHLNDWNPLEFLLNDQSGAAANLFWRLRQHGQPQLLSLSPRIQGPKTDVRAQQFTISPLPATAFKAWLLTRPLRKNPTHKPQPRPRAIPRSVWLSMARPAWEFVWSPTTATGK